MAVHHAARRAGEQKALAVAKTTTRRTAESGWLGPIELPAGGVSASGVGQQSPIPGAADGRQVGGPAPGEPVA